jgi:hypothetical protein
MPIHTRETPDNGGKTRTPQAQARGGQTGRCTPGYTGRNRSTTPAHTRGSAGWGPPGVDAQARPLGGKHRAGNSGPWRGFRGGLVPRPQPGAVRAVAGGFRASAGPPRITGPPRTTPERKKPRTRRGVGGQAVTGLGSCGVKNRPAGLRHQSPQPWPIRPGGRQLRRR